MYTLFKDLNNLIVIIAIKLWGKYHIYSGFKYGVNNVGLFPLIQGCISLFLPEYPFDNVNHDLIYEKGPIY